MMDACSNCHHWQNEDGFEGRCRHRRLFMPRKTVHYHHCNYYEPRRKLPVFTKHDRFRPSLETQHA